MITIIVVLLTIFSCAAGFFMAWTIGANDVANSMGTAVGSGALSLKHAIVIAAIFEFLGALLVGRYVTATISEGIIDPAIFEGSSSIVIYGMLSILIGSASWVTLATYFGWPVSTGHSVVGGLLGFGIVNILLATMDAGDIKYVNLISISLSWIISPIVGGIFSIAIVLFLQRAIFFSETPLNRTRQFAPFMVGIVITILFISILFGGLTAIGFDPDFFTAFIYSLCIGSIAALIAYFLVQHKKFKKGTRQVDASQTIFGYLLVLTACFLSFSHGASDVSRSIAPLTAIFKVGIGPVQGSGDLTMLILLGIGGFGIVVGLSTWGYKVMRTLGSRIADITPARGFAATFGGATTVLICSRLGLPVSTSQVMVGAVIGIGFISGGRGIDFKILRSIGISWLITIPIAAIITGILYFVLYIFIIY